jgi:hypothetical protein
MPVIIGASYPFGIRFPACSRGAAFVAAVTQARSAPRYAESVIEGVRFHVALFDRATIADLAALHRKVFFALRGEHSTLIEHTTDGRHFFSGPSFWGCFARRLTDDRVEFPEVAHSGARCHSYFGCLATQSRQHEMYHREGWEMFYNGRHGLSPGGDSEEFQALRESGRELVALGEEIERGAFVLDRAKVKAETLNLIRRSGAHRCPLFSPAHLHKQIRKLPSVVFIGETPGWGFINCAIHGPAVYFKCYGEGTRDIDV